MAKPIDAEMEQFQNDLLASVRQMKAGKAARTTVVALTPAADARAKVGMSQSAFAALLGVSVRTLQGLGARQARAIWRGQDLATHCDAHAGCAQAGSLIGWAAFVRSGPTRYE